MNIDFTTATKKDLFKANLNGDALDFGICAQEDYPMLLTKLTKFGLVAYCGQREHRGILASFRVEKDFKFKMMETHSKDFAYKARLVNLTSGEYLHFTEMIEAQDYNVGPNAMFQRIHTLWVDIPHDREKRAKAYRKYDFESV